jgi:hypothetical protein
MTKVYKRLSARRPGNRLLDRYSHVISKITVSKQSFSMRNGFIWPSMRPNGNLVSTVMDVQPYNM